MNRLLILTILVVASTAQAQYWNAIPFTTNNNFPQASFSLEDKKGNYRIYYLDKGNIFGLEPKKDSSYQVTNAPADAPIVRMLHLLGKPHLVYMQAVPGRPNDYHLWRIADTGIATAEDLTPTKEGVQNLMLGASYNGRYIYYSSNKSKPNKIDYFRYDIAQNIHEIVFANDEKNYELMGWSRDQNLVLMKDPTLQKLFASDVQTTERFNFYTAPQKIVAAGWSADAKKIIVLEEGAGGTELKALPVLNPTTIGSDVQLMGTGYTTLRYLVNGKYTVQEKNKSVLVIDAAANADLYTSPDLIDAAANPKETLLVLVTKTDNGRKLKIFDAGKKTIVKEFSPVLSN